MLANAGLPRSGFTIEPSALVLSKGKIMGGSGYLARNGASGSALASSMSGMRTPPG